MDGIIAVSAGAGGHTGAVSPFALSPKSANGGGGRFCSRAASRPAGRVLAAETLGADFAYIGSPFLASREANTAEAFKQMVVDGGSADVIVTKAFTGARASFLAPSLRANGLDPGRYRPQGSGAGGHFGRSLAGQAVARHLERRARDRRGQGVAAGRRNGSPDSRRTMRSAREAMGMSA